MDGGATGKKLTKSMINRRLNENKSMESNTDVGKDPIANDTVWGPSEGGSEQSQTQEKGIDAILVSFATVVTCEPKKSRKNFRTLISAGIDDTDCSLPVAAMKKVKHMLDNSLVGFFVGKSIVFPLVQSYVNNTWSKYGFQKIMRDEDGFFFFKFASQTGMEQVLENSPWMIRNTPIMLTKWSPSVSLSKDTVTKVPVWVKLHKVSVMAYSEDELSIIATQVGKPVMLDAHTSTMCDESWGRISYARALIEVSADKPLKQEVIMVVLVEDGQGFYKECIRVEYEWKPPLCLECKIFGHSPNQCPKRVLEPIKDKVVDNDEGFTVVNKRKNNGKNKQYNQEWHAVGVKLTKPKPKFFMEVKK